MKTVDVFVMCLFGWSSKNERDKRYEWIWKPANQKGGGGRLTTTTVRYSTTEFGYIVL